MALVAATALFSSSLQATDTALAQKWRVEDIAQRNLVNARREMDEKIEQLKGIANLSALIGGFSVVELVETNVPSEINQWLVAAFGTATSIIVGCMTLSMIMTTFMLVGVLKKYDAHTNRQPFREFWVLRCEEDWNRAF